jgi:hypothetical protein
MPAPQMMTRYPASRAPAAACSAMSGALCTERTRASQPTENSFKTSTAAFMTPKSESLPIKMRTFLSMEIS